MDSHAELKLKIKLVVENYIKNYGEEFSNFRKQNKQYRENLKTKWAELPGSDVMIRELNRIPETLYALLKIGLSDSEFLEMREQKIQFWLGNTFPDLRVTEEKL